MSKGGHSLVSYLRGSAGAATDPGSLERTILAAVAAGADPRSFGGRDVLSALEAKIGANGSVSGQTNLTAFAVLALRAAGAALPPSTLPWLARSGGQRRGVQLRHRRRGE